MNLCQDITSNFLYNDQYINLDHHINIVNSAETSWKAGKNKKFEGMVKGEAI